MTRVQTNMKSLDFAGQLWMQCLEKNRKGPQIGRPSPVTQPSFPRIIPRCFFCLPYQPYQPYQLYRTKRTNGTKCTVPTIRTRESTRTNRTVPYMFDILLRLLALILNLANYITIYIYNYIYVIILCNYMYIHVCMWGILGFLWKPMALGTCLK